MSELRILQVIPELNVGGVERVTIDMVRALRDITPETYVAAQSGPLLKQLQSMGGLHLPLPLASKNPLQMIRNAFSLARAIRKHNIQLIHARSRAPAWSALLAAKLTKTPMITSYHGAYNSTNVVKKFYNSVMARGDKVIAISEFIMSTIHKHHPRSISKVRFIPEGIDLEEFNPRTVCAQEIEELRKSWNIPKDAIVFLVPGRVTRLKGQTVFIEAIRRLNNPLIVGVILGQHQENSSYPMEVRHLSQGLPIRLISHISRPRTAYAAADFIVNPSLAQEAFGRVTAEAGAMEKVIIATNLGATRELCLDGKTGLLIPPGDSKAMANVILHALTLSPQEIETMGKSARSHIQSEYTLDRMCSQTIELYKELIR